MSKVKGFFKKKLGSRTNSISKANNLSIPLSEDHPFLMNLQHFRANKIEGNNELKSQFTKLLAWLSGHPNTAQHFDLYHYPKKVDNNYLEFRQYALTTQITQGYNFVFHHQISINSNEQEISLLDDPPRPELSHLIRYHSLYQKALQQHFFIQLLNFEISNLQNVGFVQNNQIAANLVSLLASVDAVPNNYIPFVHFSELDTATSNEKLENNFQYLAMQRKCQKHSLEMINLLKNIEDLYLNYSDSKDSQLSEFRKILNEYMPLYDEESRCLNYSTDPTDFIDFITHPKCFIFPEIQSYYNNPSPETFHSLVEKILDSFSIRKGEESSVVNALCSLAFALPFIPEIKIDGSQMDDNDTTMFAFNVIIICDPILTLRFIAENIDLSQELEESISFVIKALKSLTSDWAPLLQFVMDYAQVEYLSSKLNSIRFMILQALQQP